MPTAHGHTDRPGLRPETFARLEVCVLSATPRLNDDQVLDLADALYAVVRARRRRPYEWLGPAARRRRGLAAPAEDGGKVVRLWPRRG